MIPVHQDDQKYYDYEEIHRKSYIITLNTNIRTQKMKPEKIEQEEDLFYDKIKQIMDRMSDMIPSNYHPVIKDLRYQGKIEIAPVTSCLHYHGVIDIYTTNKNLRIDYGLGNRIAAEYELYLNFELIKDGRRDALDYVYKTERGDKKGQ